MHLTSWASVGNVEAGLEGVDGLLVLSLFLQDPCPHQVVGWLLPHLTQKPLLSCGSTSCIFSLIIIQIKKQRHYWTILMGTMKVSHHGRYTQFILI